MSIVSRELSLFFLVHLYVHKLTLVASLTAHDTAGTGVASMLAAAQAGADAVDAATDAMSGTTAQPSMGALVASTQGTKLDTGLDLHEISMLNEYWEECRGLYAPFESGQKSGSADVYIHEMPGGQYTNLLYQSTQLGLTGQWSQVKTADLPDGDVDREECNYTRQYFVGAEEYENILQRDLDDLNNYRQTQYCKIDPREDWNVAMSIEAVQASQRRWVGSSGNDGGFRAMEIEAKATTRVASDQLLTKEASDSINNEEDTKPQAKSPKKSALLQPGSFHLHQKSDSNSANCSSQGDAEEFLFYQSSDGQLCFLSGINVACLMHEFSLHRRVEETAKDDNGVNDNVSPSTDHDQQPNAQLPLPDELTATVVAIEELVVTSSLIKRKHFLSHIPLGTSVYFAEIDMYSGGDGGNKPMLSHNTLSKFKGELQRRKSERLRALKREHKADNVARAKAAKDDQRRLRELLGSHYVEGAAQQQIDPDDEFFQAPAASFDESEALPSPTFRFNEVCATGGVWPELNLSGREDTVATSASPVQSLSNVVTTQSQPQTKTTSWGKVVSTPKVVVNSFPSLSESFATQKSQSKGNRWSS